MARVLEFELLDHGWARAAVILDDNRIEMHASFIHDTFGGMLRALLSVCEGQRQAEWLYFHEPEATHAVLERDVAGTRLTVLRAKDGFKFPRPQFGYDTTVIAEGKVQLRDLVADCITQGSRMLDLYGEAGFKSRWQCEFPSNELEQLMRYRQDGKIPAG